MLLCIVGLILLTLLLNPVGSALLPLLRVPCFVLLSLLPNQLACCAAAFLCHCSDASLH